MMETKDIYTASGGVTGGNMETKSVPGYVPSPVVHPDFVEADAKGDATETADETTGNEDGKSSDSKSSGSSKTASKSTTQK